MQIVTNDNANLDANYKWITDALFNYTCGLHTLAEGINVAPPYLNFGPITNSYDLAKT